MKILEPAFKVYGYDDNLLKFNCNKQTNNALNTTHVYVHIHRCQTEIGYLCDIQVFEEARRDKIFNNRFHIAEAFSIRCLLLPASVPCR